jgi:hypothetical protein
MVMQVFLYGILVAGIINDYAFVKIHRIVHHKECILLHANLEIIQLGFRRKSRLTDESNNIRNA